MTTINCFQSKQQAHSYKKNSSMQYEWAASTIQKYFNTFRDAKNICDIGCGGGTITMNLIRNVFDKCVISGFDSSPEQIKLAIETQNNNNCDNNIDFQVQNVEDMTAKEAFDLVFSNCCLHWLLDQNVALRNIHTSLITGGKVIIILPNKDENNLSALAEKIANKDKWKQYFEGYVRPRSYYYPEEYKQLLLDNGFNPIDISLVSKDIFYDNLDALREWVKPINPHYNHLPEHLKEQFLEEVIEQLMSRIEVFEDGKIKLDSIKLEIYAIKS